MQHGGIHEPCGLLLTFVQIDHDHGELVFHFLVGVLATLGVVVRVTDHARDVPGYFKGVGVAMVSDHYGVLHAVVGYNLMRGVRLAFRDVEGVGVPILVFYYNCAASVVAVDVAFDLIFIFFESCAFETLQVENLENLTRLVTASWPLSLNNFIFAEVPD